MKYWFIKSNEKVFPIDKMCKVLEVSFSSYYRWKRSSVSNKVTKKEHLKVVINDTYFQYKQRYGSPRLCVDLQKRGIEISRITVAKYMKEMGLRSKLSKKFRITTDSNHDYLIVENHLNRQFKQTEPSKAWVGYLILPIYL